MKGNWSLPKWFTKPARRLSSALISERLFDDNNDQLQRQLGHRQLQLLVIGASIGTALFISIGSALASGGPGSLFIAYLGYSCVVAMVNNCAAEFTTYMPVSGGFARLAGAWIDDAVGFMAGWNFFLYQALLIPLELTALSEALRFWRDDIPQAAVIAVGIIIYALLNICPVSTYGEIQFWISSGKVLLIAILLSFTLVAMSGGNPRHDAFGFNNWRTAFAPEHSSSSSRFQGFLSCLWSASFCIVGPEYCSFAAAETKRPRTYIKRAFIAQYLRLPIVFGLGALAVGILVPSNDPKLLLSGTSHASPYIIAIKRLSIPVLPDLVNALIISSIFSAGNAYLYFAIRSIYGLALDGRGPRILRYCHRGIPVYCFSIVTAIACLAFLQLGAGSARVLKWLLNLTTAGGLINYMVICLTYIFFYKSCRVQGIDRKSLPYTGWCQPWCAYVGLICTTVIVLGQGYTSLKPFDTSFWAHYAMLILAVVLLVTWLILQSFGLVTIAKVDLMAEKLLLDSYEASFVDPPVTIATEMMQLIGLRRREGGNDRRTVTMIT